MRKRVDWLKVLHKLDNPDIDKLFFHHLGILRYGKHFSSKRCAYYALKEYYSTTTIDQLLEKIGL